MFCFFSLPWPCLDSPYLRTAFFFPCLGRSRKFELGSAFSILIGSSPRRLGRNTKGFLPHLRHSVSPELLRSFVAFCQMKDSKTISIPFLLFHFLWTMVSYLVVSFFSRVSLCPHRYSSHMAILSSEPVGDHHGDFVLFSFRGAAHVYATCRRSSLPRCRESVGARLKSDSVSPSLLKTDEFELVGTNYFVAWSLPSVTKSALFTGDRNHEIRPPSSLCFTVYWAP